MVCPSRRDSKSPRFEREIQPLLNERCVSCHGGDSPQSGLDLHTLASTLRGGQNGPVVLEGFSEKSILVRQLVNGVMPPQGASTPLNDAEIELIRDWIDEGQFADYVDLGNPLDRAFTRIGSTTGDRIRPPVLGLSSTARIGPTISRGGQCSPNAHRCLSAR